MKHTAKSSFRSRHTAFMRALSELKTMPDLVHAPDEYCAVLHDIQNRAIELLRVIPGADDQPDRDYQPLVQCASAAYSYALSLSRLATDASAEIDPFLQRWISPSENAFLSALDEQAAALEYKPLISPTRLYHKTRRLLRSCLRIPNASRRPPRRSLLKLWLFYFIRTPLVPLKWLRYGLYLRKAGKRGEIKARRHEYITDLAHRSFERILADASA